MSGGLGREIRPLVFTVVTSAPMVVTCGARRRPADRGRLCDSAEIEVIMSNDRLGEVRFLTVAEVASIMRVSKMTVYRMVHNGDLPAVRVGRSFRVPEDAVHTYLETSFIETA